MLSVAVVTFSRREMYFALLKSSCRVKIVSNGSDGSLSPTGKLFTWNCKSLFAGSLNIAALTTVTSLLTRIRKHGTLTVCAYLFSSFTVNNIH